MVERGEATAFVQVAHVCLKAWKVTKPSRNFGFFQRVGRRTGQGKPQAAIVARSNKRLKWPPSLKRKKRSDEWPSRCSNSGRHDVEPELEHARIAVLGIPEPCGAILGAHISSEQLQSLTLANARIEQKAVIH